MSILRADSIRDRAGTGAPDFPNGLTGNLTGTATTATTATSATSLAAGATGTDLTLSGNLTVNGTTTTIDTAVTSVDSLSVDVDVGIGTTNPTSNLSIFGVSPKIFLKDTTVGQAGIGSAYLHNNLIQSRFELGINDFRCVHFNTGGDVVLSYGNSGKFLTTNDGVRVVGECQVDGVGVFKGGLVEKYNNFGTTLFANSDVPLSSGNVVRYTGNEPSSNVTVNFTGVHSTLANGESVSFTLMIDPNGTGNISDVIIDGVATATAMKWSGGSAPSASASGQDVYTFTVLKIGTATNAYEVYGAMTNYA